MSAGPDRLRADHDVAALPVDPVLAEDIAAREPPLFEVFSDIAARQPDHLAVDDGTVRLSYVELRDRALALGARVAALVPADGLVGVLVPATALCPVAWLACLAARRAFLPMDPQMPAARNQAIVAEAGLAAAIVPTMTADPADWLPAALPRIPMEASGPAPPPLPPGLPPSPDVPPHRVSMVVFTSGSTGRPRGIVLHEQSHLRRAMDYRAACDLGPGDRLLSLHPLPTSAGVRDVFAALLCGGAIRLVDLRRDGLAGALAVLRDGDITLCAAVPAVARALIALDGVADALRGLRVMRLGGSLIMGGDIAALAPLLAPTARVLVSFGMTEAGGALAQRLIDPRQPVETGRVALGTPASWQPIPGQPIPGQTGAGQTGAGQTGAGQTGPGQTISVEDADGNQVGPGETGELVIHGRHIALGHWVAGRLDPTEFPVDPVDPGSRRFRTGDLVLLRGDGMLVPIGRADRQTKINGVRVQPGDTEAALRSLPGVADAAVLVHGDAEAPMLVGFVVRARGESAVDPGAGSSMQATAQFERGLRAALAKLLPPQQIPGRIRLVPAIPLLPSLKPDHEALRALLSVARGPGAIGRAWARLRGAKPRTTVPRAPPAGRPDGATS
jgi:acyl-CoA synthetase (AMP-forming)/AMP-acid ligase II